MARCAALIGYYLPPLEPLVEALLVYYLKVEMTKYTHDYRHKQCRVEARSEYCVVSNVLKLMFRFPGYLFCPSGGRSPAA